MKTIIEPFKIKAVEPIKFTTKKERQKILVDAGYNLFLVPAEDVIIDLLTDSGTSAMSSNQWAGIMQGDESYAYAKSFFNFEKSIQEITGFKYIIPTHQGRAAEHILFSVIAQKFGKGKYIISNTHFDTTRGNIESNGLIAVDLVIEEGKHPDVIHPFKGNMDTEKLEKFINEKGVDNIPFCMITITNNTGGGQPVSMQNIKEVSAICKKYGIPLIIDACRFAENSYFIKLREEGYADKPVVEIAKEIFSYADGATMSAKKDALVNIGGFLALNDSELALKCKNMLIVTEGFPTYGGLAGRDLEAIAIGFKEGLDEDYLKYRIRSVEYLGEKLQAAGVPILLPTGGHAVYIDAKRFVPHIPPSHFPGQAVAVALFEDAGIRSCEIGSVMFGKKDDNGNMIHPPMELVRLAIPRRVYTQSHMDYVAEAVIETYKRRMSIKGMQIVYEAPILRHFTARFKFL
ncbi:MAG TPA: tryptophanase [Ignavibacteriales bacterium]|nr:tryptophanase [Ignavibacteriales bacterium]HOL81642.1 tryptophanase [Ignavibacteriales bacterium]HOM65177.1 tryptophanase [Ignavibacteriales bacterium]HPD66901.1 tryptophanase [Ignavibacteriales bacterium]HPP33756.1 tryptophanase [Ignavibacteriales bacterium]